METTILATLAIMTSTRVKVKTETSTFCHRMVQEDLSTKYRTLQVTISKN